MRFSSLSTLLVCMFRAPSYFPLSIYICIRFYPARNSCSLCDGGDGNKNNNFPESHVIHNKKKRWENLASAHQLHIQTVVNFWRSAKETNGNNRKNKWKLRLNELKPIQFHRNIDPTEEINSTEYRTQNNNTLKAREEKKNWSDKAIFVFFLIQIKLLEFEVKIWDSLIHWHWQTYFCSVILIINCLYQLHWIEWKVNSILNVILLK